ncbi:siphovirus Gp157 family protein [Achromobacter sp. GG226]|uniref:siphovirus Gp157 family protein n=1 Tax=Verticiella alkaliphila TaxID=2779529 RepID=UPI001C0DD381|nr:siphovirus Gp157 family protein [Verticiella sp. GG226]MBU4609185.1 siphovirus Gp157 family protein [Verticiella sp. GG226]
MTIPLYVLAAERRQQLDAIADLDLADDVLADTLESIEGDLEEKAQHIVAYVRDLEGDAEKIKKAEAEMAARRKAIESRVARIRAYVLDTMVKNGIKKIPCSWFVISVAKSPPAVEIFDADKLPRDYFAEPPPPVPSKTLIKKAIEDGFEVPGARLTQGVRLAIK